MVVQTLNRHPGHTGVVGLHIGAINVKRYFPRHVDLVELELDHLCIVCLLEPSFWQDQPEIHDLRLSSWLESKRSSGKLAANSASVALIPSGHHSFRLQLIAGNDTDHSMNGNTVAFASQVASPLAALDRRKHNTERSPERRRIVKLKSNERPSSSTSH